MASLAFLNLGPSEVAILVVLFLLLFGVEKAPEIARGLGRARAELDRASRQVGEAMQTEDERLLAEQLAFEQQREAHIAQAPTGERLALERAAREMGIEPAGLSDDDVRRLLRERLDRSAEEGAENAADARQ